MPYTVADATGYSGSNDESKETSHMAAESIFSSKMSKREKVLAFVRHQGSQGATDEEIERGTGLLSNTARPRRIELTADGAIRHLVLADELSNGIPYRRDTSNGRKATVWVAV